jgi:hypothetical protein
MYCTVHVWPEKSLIPDLLGPCWLPSLLRIRLDQEEVAPASDVAVLHCQQLITVDIPLLHCQMSKPEHRQK